MSNYTTIPDRLQSLLDKLEKVKPTGEHQWQACCPAHDDKNPSLSIGLGDDGEILLKCHAGCSTEDVLGRMGLEMKDLFPAGHKYESLRSRPAKPKDWPGDNPAGPQQESRKDASPKSKSYRSMDAAIHAQFAKLGAVAGQWIYPGGEFATARYEKSGRKSFRPFHKVSGEADSGWRCGDPPYKLPLYRSDDLPQDGYVYVVEGEKCADVAREIGLVAVASAHGANSAAKSDWQSLAGREVVILPDADNAGAKYADDVAAILTSLAKPAQVRIVELPGLEKGQDIADWVGPDGLRDGRSTDELRAEITELAQAAPVWKPSENFSKISRPTTAIVTYRPFPIDKLPDPIGTFVMQAAEAIGCDVAFVALPLLSALASAIGNSRRIELKRGWSEPAIIWTGIVGDSGTLKSPALELALHPVRCRQQEAIKNDEREMAAYKKVRLKYEIQLAAWKKSDGEGVSPEEPQEPVLPRYLCDDITIEALAVLLQHNWRGILMTRDELAAWFGGFDRYAQGKGGDVAKWLEMHGGRAIAVDRKSGGSRPIYIAHAAVSITGGIQPAVLQRALGREYFENGLAARLLVAYPPRNVKKWSETQVDATTEKSVAAIFDCLYAMQSVVGQDGEPEPGIVRLSPSAKSEWICFYNEHAQEHIGLSGDLSAAWSKLEGYAARLALVVHLVRGAAGDPSLTSADMVDEASIAAGVAMSRWFGQETCRIYNLLNETTEERQSRELVELVGRHSGRVSVRELMRCSRSYPTAEIAEQALAGLVRAGLGNWEDIDSTTKGGRPTRKFILADDVDTT